MRRKLAILLSGIMILGLVGCGSKKYEPTLAKYNSIYRSTTNNEPDGSYPVINVSKVEKVEGNIIISIGAPTVEQITYAFDNYLFVNPQDEKGDGIKTGDIKLKTNNLSSECEAEVWVTGIENLDEVKYIEVGPYKTDEKNKVIFEVE